MDYITHLKSSTALTPTHHKGGGGFLKAAVGIAVGIAIPIAAPAIASSIGLSTGLASLGFSATAASTIGGGLVGAALGGLSSYAMGGSPIAGALGGAVGGGIGGYNYTPSGATSAAAGGFGTSPGGEFAGTPTVGTTAAAGGGPGVVSAPAGGIQYDAFGNVVGSPQFDPSSAGVSLSAGTDAGVGDILSSTGGQTPASGYVPYEAPVTVTPPPAAGVGARPSINPANAYVPNNGQPQLSFFDKAQQGIGNAATKIGNRITDPEFLTEQGLKVGSNILTNAMVGDTPDMSARERELLGRRDAALARLQQQEAARFEAQQEGAEALQRQGDYYDPNIMGAQASFDAINRLRRAEQERLRGISRGQPGLRQQEQRRSNLDVARLGGTAFNQGFQRGVGAQAQYRTAGLRALPSPSTAYANALAGQQNAAASYYQRLQKERDDTNKYAIGALEGVFNT